MFKTHPDGMRMEPTPERVLAACRMAAKHPMERKELQSVLSLNWKADAEQSLASSVITVAMDELELLQIKNGLVVYAAEPEVIANPTAFRRYVSSKVFHKADTTFAMFSKWVIAQNERLFTLGKWEVMAKTCKDETTAMRSLNENAALGWRFWAAFLGLGYLSGTMLIPNMKLRLQDILATSFAERFKYAESIQAKEFILWLAHQLPEADLHNKLPLAVSAGLRTLNELGMIKLESWRDSERIMLYSIDGDPVNDFSHITVYEEVRQ